MLECVKSESHQLVFSGGTALAKSNIKILRMSEDVDIKLIPTNEFIKKGKGGKKQARKALIEHIIMKFVNDPRNELKLGLEELQNNEKFRERFTAFVAPMVYSQNPHDFDTCIASFKVISEQLIG